MQLLANKNILVAATGSIAIYKTLELIRLYVQNGANVKVLLTNSAKKFITPLTFETISQNCILDDNNEEWTKNSINNHISIGKWADLFIIAPATANTINKLANGIADNILLSTVLAYPNVKLLCPAANTNMIENSITKDSLTALSKANFKIIQSQTKELACRDVGNGAMAEVEDIYHTTVKELYSEEYWQNRKVVLTGGGTIEKIDDVRYISNFSSGKMAINLATALYYKGADVFLITTSELPLIKGINSIRVKSTQEMYASVTTQLNNTNNTKKPYFFSVAAVSDYIPKLTINGKIKKQELGDTWSLELKKNIDILDTLNKKGIYSIGFKAELDEVLARENAKKMLKNKKTDAVCLNIITQKNAFGSDNNEIELFTNNSSIELKQDTKFNISLKIIEHLKDTFSE